MTNSFSFAYRVTALFCAAILGVIVVSCQDTLAALKPNGHNNVLGAAIFPHNIGIGNTRNAALVEKQELNVIRAPDVIFVPTPQDVVERMLKRGRRNHALLA